MLKRYLSKLRFRSKGDLNQNFGLHVQQVGRKICGITPILSIFALVGMLGYATIAIGFGEVEGEAEAVESISNTASLIIDNGNLTDSITTAGDITYSSHSVRVKASNITGYSLTITGPTGLTGGTTITGAGGQTPANMANNSWGYAFADNTNGNEASLAYQSFSGGSQTLANNSPAVSNYGVDFTKKLVFAAKFADTATSGHYRGNVTLNLTITPRSAISYSITYSANNGTGIVNKQTASSYDASYSFPAASGSSLTRSGYAFAGWGTSTQAVTYMPGAAIELTSSSPSKTLYAIWKNSSFPSTLTTMQGMTADICRDVGLGVSKTLTDSGRGNTSYTIRKLVDGNCWMVDNLKLNLSSYTLTPSNSDVTSNYSAGTATNVTTTSGWLYNSDEKAQFSTNGLGSSSYNSTYGYYYNWYAATAGTGTYAMTSGDAPSSICPKGWKLPAGGWNPPVGYSLLKNYGSSSATENSIRGYWIGTTPADAGGAFFPAAGFIHDNSLSGANTSGFYLTRTAFDRQDVYTLQFGTMSSTADGYKSSGLSVRCVAYSS